MSAPSFYAEPDSPGELPTLRLIPDRTVGRLLFVFSLGMIYLGMKLVGAGEPGGWFLITIFGLSVIASLSVILPGVCYLEINREGVTHASCFRKKTYHWNQIERMGIIELGIVRRVGIDLNARYAGPERVPAPLKPPCGFHVSLPLMGGIELEDQLDLMQKCHRASSQAATGTTSL